MGKSGISSEGQFFSSMEASFSWFKAWLVSSKVRSSCSSVSGSIAETEPHSLTPQNLKRNLGEAVGWQVSDTLFISITAIASLLPHSFLPQAALSLVLNASHPCQEFHVAPGSLVPQFSGILPEKAAGAEDGTAQCLPSGPPAGWGRVVPGPVLLTAQLVQSCSPSRGA